MTTMPQRELTIAAPDDGRKQLGAFLRARRESLDPAPGVAPRWPAAHAGPAEGRGGDAGGRRRHLVHLAGAGAGGQSVSGGADRGGECAAVQPA